MRSQIYALSDRIAKKLFLMEHEDFAITVNLVITIQPHDTKQNSEPRVKTDRN